MGTHSVTSLMWAMVLLIIIIFLFSVIFVTGAESYVRAAHADDLLVGEIRDIFVSMPHSLLALFQIVTGGENWAHMEYVLRSMSVIYSFMLLLYVCLMLLAMMNIVTGIFVNDAIEGRRGTLTCRLSLSWNVRTR